MKRFLPALLALFVPCLALAGVPPIPPPPPYVPAAMSTPPGPIVSMGNSISAYGEFSGDLNSNNAGGYGGGGSSYGASEIGDLLALSGGRIQQTCNVVSGTYWDTAGNFGYAGATLASIIGQYPAYLAALQNANCVPAIWYDNALTENDPVGSVASATTEANIQAVIAMQKAFAPGSVIILGTPHSDGRISGSSSEMALWAVLHNYILGLDDGQTIFAFDNSTLYNDTGNSGCSTVLNGQTFYVCPLQGYTYTTTAADALSTVSIHPRVNATNLIATAQLATLNRILKTSAYWPNAPQASNLAFTGSISVTSGKVTGTAPTGSAISQPTGTAATITSTAGNPGPWHLVMVPDSGGAADLLQAYFTAYTPTVKAPAWRLYFKVKVNAVGALGMIQPYGSITMSDASTRRWQYHNDNSMNSPTYIPVGYVAGQTYTFISPSFRVPSGKTFSTVLASLAMQTIGTGTIDVSVIQEGLIPDYAAIQSHATAFPGAPTSCGGGTPAIAYGSTDLSGTFVTGTSATACTETFGLAYQATPPNCTVVDLTAAVRITSYTVSTTAITLTTTTNSGDTVSYVCNGGV